MVFLQELFDTFTEEERDLLQTVCSLYNDILLAMLSMSSHPNNAFNLFFIVNTFLEIRAIAIVSIDNGDMPATVGDKLCLFQVASP